MESLVQLEIKMNKSYSLLVSLKEEKRLCFLLCSFCVWIWGGGGCFCVLLLRYLVHLKKNTLLFEVRE